MPLPKSTRSPKTNEIKTKETRTSSAVFSIVFFAAILIAAAVSEAEESSKPAEKPSALKVKPACRWSEHESRLASYMSRIRSLEKEVSDMIESKHHIENTEKLRVLTQQISFKHSDLAKVVREYEEERLHVRFQHPDRELEVDRRYTAQHLKSVTEIAEAFGLDGRLDRIRFQVGVVFPVSEAEKQKQLRAPASSSKEDDDAMPSGLHLVK